jgi:hypothetical protein
MSLINSFLDFVGSGIIRANADSVIFRDTYLTGDLPVAETGQASLDARFVASSILGAINELIDGLATTSGLVSSPDRVTSYVEGVDTSAFVHNINHSLGTFDIAVTYYNMDPSGSPGVAQPVIVSYYPTSADDVRVELDASASGHFVVMGAQYRV